MYVVVTAFVPTDNDFTKGGTVVPVACVRVGKMVKAKRDSFKRVYALDGTWKNPPIPENKLQSKGDIRFKSFELTGSNEGTQKKPKISLLKMYQDTIIPALEEKVVNRFSNNGQVRVCIVKQEDGAGPHNCTTYQHGMKQIFAEKEWLLFNQPSQSPITNVHDVCIFPMMSKCVSKEQAVSFNSNMLRSEELDTCVKKVWADKKNLYAMSKSFVAHPQIVSSILEHDGDNNFLNDRGKLSYGVRRMYHCTEDGEGVMLSDLAPESEADTAAGRYYNERIARGLKFDKPDLRTFEKGFLTDDMSDILQSYMSFDDMPEDVSEYWAKLLLEDAEDVELEFGDDGDIDGLDMQAP